MDNCHQRDSNKTYIFVNGTHAQSCFKVLPNCIECENEKTCILCEPDYFIINYRKEICYNTIDNPDEYFYDKDNNTYVSCDSEYHSIENCLKCNSPNTCFKCKDDFTFINGNKTECLNITELGNEYYPDPDDDTNYKKCSEMEEHCLTCNLKEKCLSCEKDYVLTSENKCIDISSNESYKNSTDNKYYPCNNSIVGCIKCQSEDHC